MRYRIGAVPPPVGWLAHRVYGRAHGVRRDDPGDPAVDRIGRSSVAGSERGQTVVTRPRGVPRSRSACRDSSWRPLEDRFVAHHAIALYGVVLAILVLTVARAIVGWSGSPEPDRLGFLIRILNFVVLGGAFGSIVVFQARLPDRSLFRTVLTQLGALVLLLPLVYLEDVAVFSVPGFPHFAGQVLMASVAVSAILHAAHSLMRPRYVEQNQVSDYFVSHFFVSAREKEVVECVFQGLDTRAIAEKLFISHRTVEKHLSNVYQKTGVSNRIQLYQLLRSDVS